MQERVQPGAHPPLGAEGTDERATGGGSAASEEAERADAAGNRVEGD